MFGNCLGILFLIWKKKEEKKDQNSFARNISLSANRIYIYRRRRIEVEKTAKVLCSSNWFPGLIRSYNEGENLNEWTNYK